jgi:hypothetical protein
MNATALLKAVEGLREPYQKAIKQNAVLRQKGDLRGLSQLIIGPPRSGKTTEANLYADALARAQLVDGKEPVCIYGGEVAHSEHWKEIFKSAEGGVLIIDNIFDYRGDEGERSLLHSLIALSYDEPKHVLVLTGDAEPMEQFVEDCPPELQARMWRPIATERTFDEAEIGAYHLKQEEERRAREKAEREAAELARSKEEWRQMSEDVTLKKPAAPMKPVTFSRKNETVS